MSEENRESSAPPAAHGLEDTRRLWRALPNRLFAFLLASDAFFVGIYVLAIVMGFAFKKSFAIVNLDAETNPSSWFSATQLFLPGIAFLMLGSRFILIRKRAWELRRLWLVLGFGMVYLSMDEGGEVHERLGKILSRVHMPGVRGGGQWVSLYVIVMVLLLIYVFRDLPVVWRTWRTEVLVFLSGFVVLAIGEIGFEGLEIIYKWHGYAHLWQIGFEEGVSMVGGSIIAYAAFRVLGNVLGSEPDGGEPASLSPPSA